LTRAPLAAILHLKTRTQDDRTAMPGSLDDFIVAAASALDLPLEPAWKPAVKANLEVTLKLAATVTEFDLPDATEPAPIYKV
jgi:hypothetical protein